MTDDSTNAGWAANQILEEELRVTRAYNKLKEELRVLKIENQELTQRVKDQSE